MMSTKAYKYRGVAELGRDLDSLVDDCFYAPTAAQLNDPTEVVLDDQLVTEVLKGLNPELFALVEELTSMRHSVGIYSLSRTPTHELMWAHYAQNHQGFCIEYDLDRLLLEARTHWTRIDVKYAEEPPTLALDDLLGVAGLSVVTGKLVGHKALPWSYEDELRIMTAQAGSNHYARSAVTGVLFGCRCTEETEIRVRTALRDRTLTYSRMALRPHSYQLAVESLPRDSIDGVPPIHVAPIDDGVVVTRDDLGEFADCYVSVVRAVEIVRRDPSCRKIVLADVSRSGPHRGQIFVQFETMVESGLPNPVNWYFERGALAGVDSP